MIVNFILDVLTYTLIAILTAGIIGGSVLFFLAATWMQVFDGKESEHEQKA